jgi:hypothetical protein
LQQVIVNITGLDGTMVRPRWQVVVPKQPEPYTNWCAFGVTLLDPDANPVLNHLGSGNNGDGQDQLIRHEELTILASFYGPQGMQNASQFRDGLYVGYNLEVLESSLMGMVRAGNITATPEFINEQWIRRYDIEWMLRRQIVRTYNIPNVQSVNAELYTDPAISGEPIVIVVSNPEPQ